MRICARGHVYDHTRRKDGRCTSCDTEDCRRWAQANRDLLAARARAEREAEREREPMEARFRRDVFWVCVRYYSKPDTEVGQAALRLRANPRHRGWRADLQLVLDKVWEVNSFGF